MTVPAAFCVFIALLVQVSSVKFPPPQHNPRELLGDHNQIRAGSEPPAANMRKLEWNDALARAAEDRVKSCVHGHRQPGENTFVSPHGKEGEDNAVDSWLEGVMDYNYDHNTCKVPGDCEEYKQMVWATTYQLGCAAKQCAEMVIGHAKIKDALFVVCKYNPPSGTGRPYIEGKPCANCPNSCEKNLCTS